MSLARRLEHLADQRVRRVGLAVAINVVVAVHVAPCTAAFEHSRPGPASLLGPAARRFVCFSLSIHRGIVSFALLPRACNPASCSCKRCSRTRAQPSSGSLAGRADARSRARAKGFTRQKGELGTESCGGLRVHHISPHDSLLDCDSAPAADAAAATAVSTVAGDIETAETRSYAIRSQRSGAVRA